MHSLGPPLPSAALRQGNNGPRGLSGATGDDRLGTCTITTRRWNHAPLERTAGKLLDGGSVAQAALSNTTEIAHQSRHACAIVLVLTAAGGRGKHGRGHQGSGSSPLDLVVARTPNAGRLPFKLCARSRGGAGWCRGTAPVARLIQVVT